MLTVWTVPLALVAASLTGAEHTPPPEAQPAITLPSEEELALRRDRHRRFGVPVTVEGEGPFRFMIDTGAQATVISRPLADRLGLTQRQRATLIAMSSRREVETVAISSIKLGNRETYVRTAPLLEPDNLGWFDGILGLDTLQDSRVLLDFENARIRVGDADELGGNSGYEIVVKARDKLGQLIIADARVEGVKTAVIIDTGAQGSVGNSVLLKRLRARHVGDGSLEDVNGVTAETPFHHVENLKMGQMQLNNFAMAFYDAQPFRALGLENRPALVLGMNELQHFERVAIDFRQRRVLFDLPRDVNLRHSFSDPHRTR